MLDDSPAARPCSQAAVNTRSGRLTVIKCVFLPAQEHQAFPHIESEMASWLAFIVFSGLEISGMLRL